MLDCPTSGQPGTGMKKNANAWTSPIPECFDQPEMMDAGLLMALASILKPSFACWSFYSFLSALSPISPSLTFLNLSVWSAALN